MGITTFCSRTLERQQLIKNCKQLQHTSVSAPRRYGKTSFVLQTLAEQKFLYTVFDFFSAGDEKAAEQVILRGIGRLIMLLIPEPERALKVAKDFLPHVHFSLVLEENGLALELMPATKQPDENILDALLAIEKLAQYENKKAVLFMDEFQKVDNLPNKERLENTLKQALFSSKNITYVFSGVFQNLKNALFLSCDKIVLERIKEEEYIDCLQQLASQQWGTPLPLGVIEKILDCTACHPYYVNALCARLWNKPILATVTGVVTEWERFAREEKSRIGRDMENLSNNQHRLLIKIANSKNLFEPTGQTFLRDVGLSGASVLQSLKVLMLKEWVYQDHRGAYKVLDPLVQTVLTQ